MIRKFFTNFDMFGAQPNLRMRGESQTINLCGGIASLLILLFFVYIFIIEGLQIINYDAIETSTVRERVFRDNSNKVTETFTIAFGIQNLNLTQLKQHFSIFFNVLLVENDVLKNYTTLQSEDCTAEQWSALGQEAADYYDRFQLEDKICLKSNQPIDLAGTLNSAGVQVGFIVVSLYPCHVYGSWECLGAAAHNETVQRIMDSNTYVAANFYMINTAFNMGQKDPIVNFIESRIWVTFSFNMGSQIEVQIGTYEIITDQSMIPLVQETTINGTYIQYIILNKFENVNQQYVILYISLSSVHQKTQRIFGKLDDALSYVGGLFGLIIAFLAFFMMSFNQYRYELFVAETFNFKEGSRIKQSNFHFFMYLKYVIFDWIKMFGCCEPDWQDCRRIDKAREQAVEQIDVKMLLRRISVLEKLNNKLLLSEKQDICMYLTEGDNIETIQFKRKVSSYYEKMALTSDTTPLTMSNLNALQTIFQMGTEINLNNSLGNVIKPGSFMFFKQKPEFEDKLEQALQKGGDLLEVDEEEIGLDEDDIEVEGRLSQIFFGLPKKTRETIQETIPLKILKRLKAIHDKKQNKNENIFTKVRPLEEDKIQ